MKNVARHTAIKSIILIMAVAILLLSGCAPAKIDGVSGPVRDIAILPKMSFGVREARRVPARPLRA